MRSFLRPLGVFVTLAWCTPAALAQSGVGSGGATPEAVPSATSDTFAPGVVERVEEISYDGQPFHVERLVIKVPTDNPAVVYTMTAGGATMYSASLAHERYQRDAMPTLADVPAEKLAGGPIDVVTTWGAGLLPFRVSFKDVQIADPITRVVRRATAGVIKGGSIVSPSSEEAKGYAVNRPVAVGDTLTITAPPEVAGEYKVNMVVAGAITPAKPFATKDISGVVYEVTRTGTFKSLFETDPYFTRVSEKPGFPLTYVWPDPKVDTSPFYVEKRFTLGKNPYSLDLRVTLYNLGDKTITAHPGLTVSAWQHPEAEGGSMFAQPTNIQGATCHTNESLEHAPFNSLQSEAIDAVKAGQPAQALHVFTTPTDFIGVDTAYFAALAAPKTRAPTGQCEQRMVIYNLNAPGAWSISAGYYTSAATTISSGANACWPAWAVKKGSDHRTCDQALEKLGNLGSTATMKEIDGAWKKLRETADVDERANIDRARQELIEAGQASPYYEYTLYTGPKDQGLLAEAAPILQKAVDLGMFSFIAKPLHSLLVWLHGGVGSWALAIILLTVVVKLVLLPLTNKSYRSMQKMQKLKPKLDELKKKIGNDKQKFAQEQMALFKREGVNPLTGCFPMLLQMPVWFGLYQSIQTSVELYRAPMGLWIHDLSAPDPYYVMPILLGVLMFVQTLLTATATMDGLQGKIMKYGMPIMFSAFMLFLPSGLVLYIFVNVALTIVQNLVIKRRMSTT